MPCLTLWLWMTIRILAGRRRRMGEYFLRLRNTAQGPGEGKNRHKRESECIFLSKKGKKRICLYAGSIHKLYGIQRLVEGFRLAAIPGVELHVYGSGDYQQELEEIAAQGDSFNYEFVCGISRRVPRLYVQGGKTVHSVHYLLDAFL